MKVLGLFSDIDQNISKDAPLLKNAVFAITADAAELIVRYLESGTLVYVTLGWSVDPIDKRTGIPGGGSIWSDGEWIWRDDLSYYVGKYHIELPNEFLLHVMNNKKRKWNKDEIMENAKMISTIYDRVQKYPYQ